jgi:hypothetical protein
MGTFKMIIPHGCACIVVENGKALGVFKPGRYYRSGVQFSCF